MNRSDATVEDLSALLPDIDELEVLRLRLVGAAVPDPGKAWDSSSAYSTFDKRIVSGDAVDRVLDESAQAVRDYVTLLHEGLRPVFRAFYDGRMEECARALVALGEEIEGGGRLQAAGRCYRAGFSVSLPLADKAVQILALRRIARVAVTLGDLPEAASYYERSTELARDAGDLPGEVIGRTGMGNVRMWQGRWDEAEQYYHEALELADTQGAPALLVERGQIYNNLANINNRRHRLEQSEVWFESALRLWSTISSPVDLAICLFNRALLREAQDRWDEARHDFEAALAQPIPHSLHAVFATDFAEWWLHEGHVSQAEEWGRVAEEHAITAGSPYSLGYMYRGRGNIARARGDADGFTFFEKALEISHEKGYSFLEAETLIDYALMRGGNGGQEEALAYLDRAGEILRGLGALGELERAEKARAEVLALEGSSEAVPAAAAGD